MKISNSIILGSLAFVNHAAAQSDCQDIGKRTSLLVGDGGYIAYKIQELTSLC